MYVITEMTDIGKQRKYIPLKIALSYRFGTLPLSKVAKDHT